LSGLTARAYFHTDVEPARFASALSAGKPRKNPVIERGAVSMTTKICVH